MTTRVNRNGIVVWQGPSLVGPGHVAVVITGLRAHAGKQNRKTGGMLQAHILPTAMTPMEAIETGKDATVCGGCPYRSESAGGTGECYVHRVIRLRRGSQRVGEALLRGAYREVELHEAEDLVRGRKLRIGAYGDLAAVPGYVWQRLTQAVAGWTGYTSQWRWARNLRRLVMASVRSPEEAEEARAMGWRTFRINNGTRKERVQKPKETTCPASKEAGRKVQCAACMLCNGAGTAKHVTIQQHT